MRRNGRYGKKIALFGTLAVAAFTLVAGTAFAETANTSATLTAGNLSITQALTAGTFTGTLNGAPQTLSSTTFSGFNTQDARGSGSGWNVTVVASQLINADASGHNFALGSLTMPQLTVLGETNSSAVPGTLHAAAAIDNSADGATGGVVMAATSAFGQGMGTYDFANAAPWTLAVPANAFAGTYTSTVTTTLASLTF